MKDPVVQVGDPVLKARAKPVGKKDLGSRKLVSVIKRMKDALAREDFGVAIAAPQIGESLRIFVVAGKVFKKGEDEKEQTPPDKVFINPELVKLSRKKAEMTEGCLSVRNKFGTVLRHEKATLRAWDEAGKPFVYNGSGLIGHIFQHEVDHLDGILYIDKAVKVETDENWEKLGEARRSAAK